MTLYNKTKSFLAGYCKDTRGNFAIMASVSIVTLLMAVGAAIDYSQLSKAKLQAQHAADNMALAASVAVDTKNRTKYVEGKAYDFSTISGGTDDLTGTIKGSVEYDLLNKDGGFRMARATVKGNYTPAFASILGINNIKFSAVSDAAYAAKDGKPASIFFITDSSGSMASHDRKGVSKIESLKTSLNHFMGILKKIPQNNGEYIFRTALFPYNSDVIKAHSVNPKWNGLTKHEIKKLVPEGRTKSTAALRKAKIEFAREDKIHEEKNGQNTPLKILIFMSDGANNGADESDTCKITKVWERSRREFWMKKQDSSRKYYNEKSWFNEQTVTHYPASSVDRYENELVCGRWPDEPFHSPVNKASLKQCDAMKKAGVRIYTIAYNIEPMERKISEEFLQSCSSGEGFYKYAVSGADLTTAFEEIGKTIVNQVVRIVH
ncbi:MAG: pilus assembly protein TadG-related protein [Robiginitomaculum sp.]